NLWGAVVGRPGLMKTQAMRQPVKFLERLQVEAKMVYEAELKVYEAERFAAEVKKKEKKQAITDAIKKKQDPLAAAKQLDVEEPQEPSQRRYIVNDSSVEKVGELLNKNPNGFTIFRDELVGWLKQLDKPGQEGSRGFYLEAWDGL